MRCLPTQILVHKHFSISLCSSFAISYSYKQINWPLAMIVLEPNFFRLSAKMCTFFRARASNQMVSKSQTSLLYPHRYEVGKVVTKDRCEKSFESQQLFTDGIFRDSLINKTEVGKLSSSSLLIFSKYFLQFSEIETIMKNIFGLPNIGKE